MPEPIRDVSRNQAGQAFPERCALAYDPQRPVPARKVRQRAQPPTVRAGRSAAARLRLVRRAVEVAQRKVNQKWLADDGASRHEAPVAAVLAVIAGEIGRA